MGLDVTLYKVKKHKCENETSNKLTTVYKHKEGGLYYNDIMDSSSFESFSYRGKCSCFDAEDNNLLLITTGFVSFHDHESDFKPGDIVEIVDSENFYFGSYLKWAHYFFKIDILSCMSDCDGTYSGKRFLTDLHDAFAEYIKTDDDCPSIEQYHELLEKFPLEECVLVHS